MKKTRRLLAMMLILAMAFAFAACASSSDAPAATTTAAQADDGDEEKKETDAATTADSDDSEESKEESTGAGEYYEIEMFNSYANYMGVATGWWAEILKRELNMGINIIAPNVAGTGDTLYQTRTAAGNLGDAIIQGKSRMIDCYDASLLADMTPYLENSPNLQKLSTAYESFATMFGDGSKVYAIPGRVSTQSPTSPAGRGLNPEVGYYLRYDWYQSVGAPEIEDGMEGFLDIIDQMIEANPTNQNGDPTFGFSFFPDWDGDSVRAAREMLYLHGYTSGNGHVWMNEDGTKTTLLSEDNGIYYQYLQLFNKAYRMGLVDVDSSTQNWDTIKTKFDDGRVAFGWWPFLASSIFDRIDLEARSPYAPIPVKGMVLNSPGYNPYGLEGNAFAVGIGAQYPERIMEFYEWLSSQQGILYTNSHVEGVTFEMRDGEPYLTEFGLDSNLEKLAPEELGGGDWAKGASQINYPLTHQDDPNELLGGFSSNASLWPSTIALNENEFNTAYIETYGGYPFDAYADKGMLVVTPGTDYTTPSEPSDITTIRAQITELFQPAGWQMIYAETDEQFESIWQDMKSKLDDFGYQELIEYDTKIVEEKAASIAKAMG